MQTSKPPLFTTSPPTITKAPPLCAFWPLTPTAGHAVVRCQQAVGSGVVCCLYLARAVFGFTRTARNSLSAAWFAGGLGEGLQSLRLGGLVPGNLVGLPLAGLFDGYGDRRERCRPVR